MLLNKHSYILLFSISLISCIENKPLHKNDLIGEYENVTGAKNFNYLYLKEDFTYHGIQSELFGDAMMYYFGNWEIKDSVLILFKGEDISDYINVQEIRDIHSDTLVVNIENSIINRLPEIKYSILNRAFDLEVTDYKIKIDKRQFWDFSDPKVQGIENYEFIPFSLNLRFDNLYANIEYIFANKEISISLNEDFILPGKSTEVLCKYRKKDDILYSFDESWEIKRNELVKTTIKYVN